MRKISTPENADIRAGEERQRGMRRSVGSGHCILDLFPGRVELSQVKQAGTKKEVACHLLRQSAFTARIIDGFLSKSPRLFQLAAHNTENPCATLQREQVPLIARAPRKQQS